MQLQSGFPFKSFRQTISASPSYVVSGNSTIIIIDVENEQAKGRSKVTNDLLSHKAIVSLLKRHRDANEAPRPRDANGKFVRVNPQTLNNAPVVTWYPQVTGELGELRHKDGE